MKLQSPSSDGSIECIRGHTEGSGGFTNAERCFKKGKRSTGLGWELHLAVLEAHGLLDVLDLGVAADLAGAGIPDVQQLAPAASGRLPQQQKCSAITLKLPLWKTSWLTFQAKPAYFQASLDCCQAQSEDKETVIACDHAMLLHIVQRVGRMCLCEAKAAET